jgi:hypothetical protein
MLTPLYTILPITILVTVAAPGAGVGDDVVPVEALSGDVPSGTFLKYAPGKVAVLAADAAEGAEEISVEALTFALVAGNEAGYAPPDASELLSEKYANLPSDNARRLEQIRAEIDLGLRAPKYTGTDAEELAIAVALQINFNLDKPDASRFQKSVANQVIGTSGASTTYRDRTVDPEAAAIVLRVTGAAPIRFAPPFAGV